MFTFAPVRWQVAPIIPRWRLRRIARIGRRFLAILQFQPQGFVVGFQLRQLFKLAQDQLDQFFSAQSSQVILGHYCSILPKLTPFA